MPLQKDKGNATNHKDKGQSQSKSTNAATSIVPPPDGGWGWMVVMSSFMVSLLVDGVCFSPGIFFNTFREYFQASKAQTAWVGSVLNGSYLIIGPVVSAFVNRYGCRPVAMFGSVFAATAIFLSTFAPDMPALTLIYGLLGGVGFGFVYLPAMVMVGYYFERRRALATGIACCGSGIGAFLFAPLCYFLLEEYGWKGATWILSAMVLNGLVFSIFYRPLEHLKATPQLENGEAGEQSVALLDGKEDNLEEATEVQDFAVSTTVNDLSDVTYVPPVDKEGESISFSNENNKRVADSPPGSQKTWPQPMEVDSKGQDSAGESVEKSTLLQENGKGSSRMRGLFQTVTPKIQIAQAADSKAFLSDFQLSPSSPVARMAFSQEMPSVNNVRQRKPQHHQHHRHRHHHHHLEVDSPLQRRDIFYSGSLRNIPEYRSSHSLAEYRQKVTRVDAEDEVSTADDIDVAGAGSVGRRSFFKRMVCDRLLEVFDVSLLKSPTFVIYGLSCVLNMMGFFIPFIYLPTLCIDLGISATEAAFLISIIGIANTIGRVAVGFVSDQPWADCLLINNVALVIGGLVTCLVPFLNMYPLFAAYSFVFGTSIAIFVSLRSIIMVDLMGLEKLTNAFGLVIMCQGISSFVGAPIAGLLSDLTGDYNLSFYLSGICMGLGGLICFPLRRIARWENAKASESSEEAHDLQLT